MAAPAVKGRVARQHLEKHTASAPDVGLAAIVAKFGGLAHGLGAHVSRCISCKTIQSFWMCVPPFTLRMIVAQC